MCVCGLLSLEVRPISSRFHHSSSTTAFDTFTSERRRQSLPYFLPASVVLSTQTEQIEALNRGRRSRNRANI